MCPTAYRTDAGWRISGYAAAALLREELERRRCALESPPMYHIGHSMNGLCVSFEVHTAWPEVRGRSAPQHRTDIIKYKHKQVKCGKRRKRSAIRGRRAKNQVTYANREQESSLIHI